MVGGKKVLTLRTPSEGVVDLELKQGQSELDLHAQPTGTNIFVGG